MLELNLLPPEEKIESSFKWKYFVIKNFILLNLTTTLVVAIVLFAAKLALIHELEQVKSQSILVKDTYQKINKEIKIFNKKLEFINSMQKDFIPWSQILYPFFTENILANNITIKTIEFDTINNTFTLNGIAPTRNDLIALRESLNKNKLIENLDIPLSYLLKKENIEFNLSATFKLNK